MKKITAILTFFIASTALSDITVPVGQQGDDSTDVPTHGQKMDEVLDTFGEPIEEHATVGEPPITRWDYDAFIVVFEHETVIQAVKKQSN